MGNAKNLPKTEDGKTSVRKLAYDCIEQQPDFLNHTYSRRRPHFVLTDLLIVIFGVIGVTKIYIGWKCFIHNNRKS